MTRILIADSETDVCDFMFKFFEDRNFEVFTATNGSDILRITKEGRPHIVLLDIKMPDGDGMEILREIKKADDDAKVVIVTCVEDGEAVKQARSLGATAYITKPLVLSDLMEVVLGNLGRRRSFFNFGRHLR